MKIKKVLSLILVVAVALSLVPALGACNKEENNDGKILIYYTNNTAEDLHYRAVKIKTEDVEPIDLILDLLDRMFNSNLEDKSYYSVKPAEVEINSINLKDGIIAIDFNSEYLKLTNVREIILRAGVVLTLIQVPGVIGVSFTVDNVPITDRNNEVIGTMTKEKFVNVLLNEEGMLKQTTELKVYFANETKDKLVPVYYTFSIDNTSLSMEEYLITKLIEGPEKDPNAINNESNVDEQVLIPTVSDDVELISVVTTDRTCYINFGHNFLEQKNDVSDEIMIYSIVNTVCQLPYVSSVQFLIEGEREVELHKTISFAEKFKYNSIYIQ